MDEGLRNRVVIILAVLTLIFFFGTLSSCNNALRQKARSDKEMAARIALEEKVSKFAQESSALEEKAKAKEKEAEDAKLELETAKKALIEEQAVNQGLNDQLRKTGQPKEAVGK
ncbi:hypothetical protein EPN54_00515 [bacterium]|nr:MAG: hypothetical protein EPN54_00515 [bacterium]